MAKVRERLESSSGARGDAASGRLAVAVRKRCSLPIGVWCAGLAKGIGDGLPEVTGRVVRRDIPVCSWETVDEIYVLRVASS